MNSVIINRKPIFDAVRRLIGRGFTQAEVELLDRAIDLALDGRAEADSPRLGSLSEMFESGGRGPGTVSGGIGDPGGVSYGTYQLSSRTGTAARFMASEGAVWARHFGKAAPGSASFSRAWRELSQREPEAFGAAQNAFIARTHYRPAVAAVLEATGVDLDTRHSAVREATWSVAVQHGRASGILIDAVQATQLRATPEEGLVFDRVLVGKIYDERSAYVLRVTARAGPAAARTLRSIVRNRYPAERQAALAMLG